MKYKVNDIIKHKWPPYPSWTCFSQIIEVNSRGIILDNIINISSDEELFNLDNIFIDFLVPYYEKMKIEIVGQIRTPEEQIKNIQPEYFL